MFPLGHSSLPAGEVANSSFPACCLWARTRYTGGWNADYYFCELRYHVRVPEKLFFAWLVWYLTWLTTPYWKWSGVRFMRAPTKPRRVGKIDRQELEAGTSPSGGSPGVWLFCPFVLVMSFGRRWEISCLLWWLFKFTTKIRNINSNSCQATLPRCFPPSVQLDRLHKEMNGTNNLPGANQFWFQIPSKNHPLTTYPQINPWSSSREHWSKTSSGIYAPTWTKRQRLFKNFKVSKITFLWNSKNYMWAHFIRIMFFFP